MSYSTLRYSNCSDVIHQALLHEITPGSATRGGSGPSATIATIAVVLVLLATVFGGLAIRRRGR